MKADKEESKEQPAKSFALAAELLQEVCDDHADERSVAWNDCGTPEKDCEWCRLAKEWIAEQKATTPNPSV